MLVVDTESEAEITTISTICVYGDKVISLVDNPKILITENLKNMEYTTVIITLSSTSAEKKTIARIT